MTFSLFFDAAASRAACWLFSEIFRDICSELAILPQSLLAYISRILSVFLEPDLQAACTDSRCKALRARMQDRMSTVSLCDTFSFSRSRGHTVEVIYQKLRERHSKHCLKLAGLLEESES